MKIPGVTIFLLFTSVALAQNQSANDNAASKDSLDKFRLSFSTFNHAEMIFNGTTTYILTKSSIKVTKTYFGETKSKTIYSKPVANPQQLISLLNVIRLDSLKNYYTNHCVMLTSGDEYFLDFTNNSNEKSISLHHYYLKQLEDIIHIINSLIPKKYQFQYLSKDTEQNCTLEQLLHKS